MAEQLPDRPSTGQQAEGLRSLRQIINAPTQQAVDELRRTVARLHDDVHTPPELTKLLIPIIADVLQKKAATSAQEIIAALAPIIDKTFAERTQQDKDAIVKSLAPSVAKALREQHKAFPDEVAEDLAPLMGAAIREQVREQRDAMVDALYPIIGSTIAKYMAEALRGLLENINKQVEQTFTFKGISRRLRAKAMGVSEAELILQESLPFTVHAVFLIHKASGILIAQARNPQGRAFDSDLASGMLTAIRSFVNDWIARSGEVSEIHSIEYGMSQIMLEVAGNCYLAVVIEGEPSQDYIGQIRKTLSKIVAASDKEIAAFDGNQSSVPHPVHTALQTLIVGNEGAQARPKHSMFVTALPLIVILLLVIGIPLGWYWYSQNENQRIEHDTQLTISAALGYSNHPVTVEANGENLKLKGQLPNELLRHRAEEVARRALPFATVESQITVPEGTVHPVLLQSEVTRITTAFNTLRGVRLSSTVSEGNVTLLGTVEDDAVKKEAIAAIEKLPGVSSVSYILDRNVFKIPFRILFEKGSSEIPEAEIQNVHKLANLMNLFPHERVKIIGHSDNDGSKAKNIPITLGRAVAVKNVLVQAGIAESRIEVEGEGLPLPGIDPTLPENRCVRFFILPKLDSLQK